MNIQLLASDHKYNTGFSDIPHKCKIEIKLNTIGCGARFLTKEKNLKQKMVKIRADPVFSPFGDDENGVGIGFFVR